MLKSQKFNTRMLSKIASRSLSSKTHWPYHALLNSRKTPLATENPQPLTNDDLRGCQRKPQDVCFCIAAYQAVGLPFFWRFKSTIWILKNHWKPPSKPLICVFPPHATCVSPKKRQLDLSAGHGDFPRQPRPNGLFCKSDVCFFRRSCAIYRSKGGVTDTVFGFGHLKII